MENLLWYKKPAENFEEALPLGNGKIGAMVYGKTDVEKISLNADSLWTGYPSYDVENNNAYNSYLKMRKAFNDNKIKEAEEILENGFVGIEVQAYLPAGNLFIKAGDKSVTNYKRSLNLENGMAESTYNLNECKVKSETFISAVDNVLVHKIETAKKHDFEIWLESPLKNDITIHDDVIVLKGQAPDKRENEPELFTYDRDDTVKYSMAMKVMTDGIEYIKEGKVSVGQATYVIVYLSVITSYTAWNRLPDGEHMQHAQININNAAKKGYDAVKKSHTEDFSSYYNRVKLNIKTDENNIPTDERIKAENKDTGLAVLLFNFGRYLLISSSRSGSLATNLQGIWNEEPIAPWASNYTVNINTEMNYWPALMCDLAEFMDPLIELIKMTCESGKRTAKEYYNVDKGFTAHHNYDIWGKTTPAPGSPRWSYWCMSSGWMCRHLFEYYQYTNDIKFLEETAFPIMYEAALFYMEIMEEHDGKLIITPSTSPENGYMHDKQAAFLAKYTTMTQAILIDLFENLKKTCDILGKTELKRELDEKYPIEKLDVYKIGSKGQLLEYDEEYEEEDIHHRHVSHLYGLYPGESINSEELINAAKRSLEIRGDGGTGWSLGWKVNLWSKLKDGNHSLQIVKNQLNYIPATKNFDYSRGGTFANLFDAHPPFQIDGNFGVTSGIAQMFLQCENDTVKILPALPDEFGCGSIEGLKAVGNITVSVWWNDKKVEKIRLISPVDQTIKISIQNNQADTLTLKKDIPCEMNF